MADEEIRNLEDLQATHRPPPATRFHKVPAGELAEQAAWRNYVRDLILGFNDGLVSVYAAVAGVAGAALGRVEILVAGFAFAAAGALSMGLGEYISTKGQAEYYENEAERERDHIRKYPGLEKQEVREMLEDKGYPEHVVDEITTHVTSDEDRFVDFMMREEFGVGEESERSPWVAMFLVMGAFIIGASLPVVPYLFPVTPLAGLYVATALSLSGLFVAGSIRGAVSGIRWWKSGFEMAVIGALAASVTFLIGRAFGVAVA